MTTRREVTQALLGAAGLLASGLPVKAQPRTTLDTAKILVGFPPGGTTDALSRRVAEKLRGAYANLFLVENKPGAGGQIAITTLKNSPPDGSSLLLTPSSCLSVYPFTYPRLPYSVDDVAPVTLACSYSLAIGVGPAVPASVKNMKDFIAWVKANPAQANYGSPAAGSIPHLTAALAAKMTNIEMRHVAYRGSAPGIQDLLGGQISAMCSPVGDYLQHVKAGKLRLLATTGPARSPFTPDVPTLQEQGIDIAVREWYGFFLPGKTSTEVRSRAAAYLQTAINSKDVVDSLATAGMEAQASTPDELANLLKADMKQWQGIVKSLNFTAES